MKTIVFHVEITLLIKYILTIFAFLNLSLSSDFWSLIVAVTEISNKYLVKFKKYICYGK